MFAFRPKSLFKLGLSVTAGSEDLAAFRRACPVSAAAARASVTMGGTRSEAGASTQPQNSAIRTRGLHFVTEL